MCSSRGYSKKAPTVNVITLSRLMLCAFLLLIIPQLVTASYLEENTTWEAGLTHVRYGSHALGDVDNDGDLDLAYIGCTSMTLTKCTAHISKIYINNGINLTEDVIWQQNLTPMNYGSLVWGDSNNDGWLDLYLSGCISGGGYTKTCDNASSILYLNNGTTLIESTIWGGDIVDVWRSSVVLGDVDM